MGIKTMIKKNSVFLDTSYAIALSSFRGELYFRAFELFKQRNDKEWGLTDCISFIVMKDYAINDVLSADIHFRQAGYNILLK